MAVSFKLDRAKLDDFLQALCRDRTVFALEECDGAYHLTRSDRWDPRRHTLGAYRPVEPLKSLVFRPREFLGAYGEAAEPSAMRERIVIGVKNCDLSSLKIHDYVFMQNEPRDPFYAEAREKTIIVACDCTAALDVCFCPLVDEQPYAREGFDINIATAEQAYLVESGSERGERLLKQVREFFTPVDDALRQERDRKRAEMTKRVCALAEKAGLKCGMDLQKAVQATEDARLWEEFAADCVECGACNFVCCTCHCFLLADGKSEKNAPARVKQWDSCLYTNFARVAGGANPRKHRAQRLYNRFDKKFNFFQRVLGIYGCDGCGRCIQACTGKIDIREVLKRAVDAS